MSNKPILFYSRRCKNCITLWNQLKIQEKLNLIIKIDIDKNKNIPSNISAVPTLLVKGRPLIMGDSINLFMNTYSQDIEPKTQNAEIINENSDIKDYMPGEMGSYWSDSYSYLDSDNPIGHSYSFIGSESENINKKITNVKNDKNFSDSRKNNDLSQRLEEFKNQRDKDFSNNRK